MVIKRAFTGAPWEKLVGYCRAVRSGPFIAVSGTTSVNPDGSVHGAGEPYQQALRCFELIEKALKELHADRKSIVRTRMFVTDISKWKDFGRAHAEFFADNPPATSMIEVKALIDPQLLIEVEADAID
jgi:enamine deaminase RidA (YjgF/YER057c/UK114 family)